VTALGGRGRISCLLVVVTLCIRCGRHRSQQGFTSLQSEENALFSAGRRGEHT
jgi:hypothetical protein